MPINVVRHDIGFGWSLFIKMLLKKQTEGLKLIKQILWENKIKFGIKDI